MSLEQSILELAAAIRELAASKVDRTRTIEPEPNKTASTTVAKPAAARTVAAPVKDAPTKVARKEAPEPEMEPDVEAETSDRVVGFGEVVEITTKLSRMAGKGKPAVVAILAGFGASKITELKETDYAEYVEMATVAAAA